MASVSKRNFTRGIFSPVVQSRRDVDAWSAGARRLTNVTLLKYGGVRKRPGTRFVYKLPDNDDVARLLPFTYSPGQSYVLLMGQATMKPLALGGAVLSAGFGITAITQANPGVVTAPYHGLSTGDEVYLTGFVGMDDLDGRVLTVTVLDDDNFSIGVDTTGYPAFVSDDGDVRVAPPDPPPTPPVVPAPTPTPTPAPTVPPGGGGGFCVSDDTLILMGDGREKRARDIVVGDMVLTRHETTMKWGEFPIARIEFAVEKVFRCIIDGTAILATGEHPFWRGGWVLARDIGKPAGSARVAKIEVKDAHTYVSAGVLSHNKRSDSPDDEPI